MIERFVQYIISQTEFQGITCLLDLDFFLVHPDDTSDIRSSEPTTGNVFCADATHYGNVSRFFNHSCIPNVAIYTVVHNGDNRVYDLAVFTVKPIKPYEELCFDYKTKNSVKVR
jgi:[histone H3]-lysine9 N-trimethyltransferase SUV39H